MQGNQDKRRAGYDNHENILRLVFGSDMELDEFKAPGGLMDTEGHGQQEWR